MSAVSASRPRTSAPLVTLTVSGGGNALITVNGGGATGGTILLSGVKIGAPASTPPTSSLLLEAWLTDRPLVHPKHQREAGEP